MRVLTRSARSWMVNGTPPPPVGERGGELVHPVDLETEDVVGEPDVVGPIVAAAGGASPRPCRAAGRCRYWLPQMGFAHQLQRNEQPREAAMLRLK